MNIPNNTYGIENQSDRASYADDFLLTVFNVLLKTKVMSKKKKFIPTSGRNKSKDLQKSKGVFPQEPV